MFAIDILGLLTGTKAGNQFIVVMTDQYTKLTRAISVSRIATPEVAKVALNVWIMLYGRHYATLTDNGKQFASKLYAALCALLDTN